MTRRLVRMSLIIIMLAIVTGSIYQLFLIEHKINTAQQDEQIFTSQTWKFAISFTKLQAAQQAYVATGQDPVYWADQVSSKFDSLTVDLGILTNIATASDAINALAEIDLLLQHMEQMDQLVLDHAATGQDLIASDLIFTDGLELTNRAVNQIELARTSEKNVRSERLQSQQSDQAMLFAMATGTSIIVAFLLLPVKQVKRRLGLNSLNLTLARARVPQAPRTIRYQSFKPAETINRLSFDFSQLPEKTTATPSPNLKLTAKLCTDLGRLTNIDELSGLLANATALLDASGLVIWIRNEDGNTLRPAMGHGYSSNALFRMGTISCDSDNATAAAFRTEQLCVVPKCKTNLGAIVVPLLASNYCVGVMSVEIKEGRETSESVQAIASLLAAQLATLVAADPVHQAKYIQG